MLLLLFVAAVDCCCSTAVWLLLLMVMLLLMFSLSLQQYVRQSLSSPPHKVARGDKPGPHRCQRKKH